MHIPDGLLSLPVCAGTGVAAVLGVGLAVRLGTRALGDRQVPLMGVMGAFVFAAQMINVPVAAGTSGHLMGGALLTALLGPHLAALVLTCVLVVQALLFQDGGVLALGANVLNMAIVGPYVAAAVFAVARRGTVGLFLAGWLSVLIAAVLASAELALSGTVPFGPVVTAMGLTHAIIGILEGALTVAVVRFLLRVRPDLATGAA